MTKKEHIEYWLNSADEDWQTVEALFNAGRYVHSLFFGHLTLEKYCKAIWIKKCSGHVPPKTHNLLHILKNAAVSVPEDVEQKIVIINTFNIEGRYPSDIKALQRRCTKAFTSDMLNDIEQLTQWLYEMT